MTQSTFLVARENNLPQTVNEFYKKEYSSILFKYHYISRSIEKLSIQITDLLSKIEQQHSKHKVIKTEVKEETKLKIKVDTKMYDNKSTSEDRNKISKLIKILYKALIYLMFVINIT